MISICREYELKHNISDTPFWILYVLHGSEEQMPQTDICNSLYQPRQSTNTALKNWRQMGIRCLSFPPDFRSFFNFSDETITFRFSQAPRRSFPPPVAYSLTGCLFFRFRWERWARHSRRVFLSVLPLPFCSLIFSRKNARSVLGFPILTAGR